jgi:hypothetical protein
MHTESKSSLYIDIVRTSMEDNDDNELGSESSKVIAAVCYVNKVVGFACYNELSNSIFADSIPVSFEDIDDVLAQIKIAAGPTLFLIHPMILSNRSLLDLLVCGTDGMPNTYR